MAEKGSGGRLGVIFLTVFIDLIGFGIVIPVLPLYAEKFLATPFEIGALVGVYSIVQFFCAPWLGRLSDRVGRRPVLLLSVAGSSLGFALMGFANALWLLFVARIIDGVTGGNISTAQAYIADITPPEKRSKSMGLIGAAFGLGFMIGPALGGIASKASIGAPFFVAAGLAALNAVLIYFALPESLAHEHRAETHEKTSVADVLRHGNGWALGGIVAAYLFHITGFSMMTTLFALFTEHRFGYDAHANGLIFAYVGLILVIVQGGLLGRLVGMFGEKTLASAGALLLAVSLFALPFSNGLGFLLLISGGIALGNGMLNPTLTGLASRNVDRTWQGRAMGLMQSAASMGRFVGPVLAGVLLVFDTGHYARAALWTAGGILLVAFGLTLGLRVAAKANGGVTSEPAVSA